MHFYIFQHLLKSKLLQEPSTYVNKDAEKEDISFLLIFRSNRPEVFCEKGILRNFAKFTGKYLCQSLFLNKVAGLRPTTLVKKRLWHRCFPVNFWKFIRTPFPTEHLPWLLLNFPTVSCKTNQLISSSRKSHWNYTANQPLFLANMILQGKKTVSRKSLPEFYLAYQAITRTQSPEYRVFWG